MGGSNSCPFVAITYSVFTLAAEHGQVQYGTVQYAYFL